MGVLGPLFGKLGKDASIVQKGFFLIGQGIGKLITSFTKLVFGTEAVEGASVGLRIAMIALTTTGIIVLALGIYELIKHFGVLPGLMIAGAVAAGVLAVAMIFLDSIPLVAVLVAIGLAIVGVIAGIDWLIHRFGLAKVAIVGALAVLALFFPELVLIGVAIYELATHWSTVWHAMETAVVDAWHFIDGIIHAILSFFDKAGTMLEHVGRALIDGLIHGMESLNPVHIVENIGKSILHGFASVLQVFSPSKATMAMGLGLSQGLQQGITSGSAGAVGAAKSVSNQIVKAFGSLSQVSKEAGAVKALESVFSGLASVFTNLDTAASKASGIKTSLPIIGAAMTNLAKHIPGLSTDLDKVNAAFQKIGGNKTLKNVGTDLNTLGGIFTSFGNLAKASAGITQLAMLSIYVALQTIEKASDPIKHAIGGIVNSFKKLDTSKTVGPQLQSSARSSGTSGASLPSSAPCPRPLQLSRPRPSTRSSFIFCFCTRRPRPS